MMSVAVAFVVIAMLSEVLFAVKGHENHAEGV